jgi:hypothetical protein
MPNGAASECNGPCGSGKADHIKDATHTARCVGQQAANASRGDGADGSPGDARDTENAIAPGHAAEKTTDGNAGAKGSAAGKTADAPKGAGSHGKASRRKGDADP